MNSSASNQEYEQDLLQATASLQIEEDDQQLRQELHQELQEYDRILQEIKIFKDAVEERIGTSVEIATLVDSLQHPWVQEHVAKLCRPCVICHETLSCGSPLKELPCHHIFHDRCVNDWLTQSPTCPTCRCPAPRPLKPVRPFGAPPEPVSFPVPEPVPFPAPEPVPFLNRTILAIRAEPEPVPSSSSDSSEPDSPSSEPEPEGNFVFEPDTLTKAFALVANTLTDQHEDWKQYQTDLQEMAQLAGKTEEKYDITDRLRLAVSGACGKRGIAIVSAYNAGVYLNQYCEEHKLSIVKAVKTLNIKGLAKSSASLFCNFASDVDTYGMYAFLYICPAPWREVRDLLVTTKGRGSPRCLAEAFRLWRDDPEDTVFEEAQIMVKEWKEFQSAESDPPPKRRKE
jgi:hypothetical protein